MKKRFVWATLATFFTAVIIISCSKGLPDEFPTPDFSLDDIFTGENIQLTNLKGRPVLIYFFASW